MNKHLQWQKNSLTVLNTVPVWGKNSFRNPFFLSLAADFLETFLRLFNMVENNRSYFNCRRQLFRFFKGSLLTAVAGFNSSSSKAAGTGQSGILTGVTGFEELFSPFSSFLWLKAKKKPQKYMKLFHQCHFYHIKESHIYSITEPESEGHPCEVSRVTSRSC